MRLKGAMIIGQSGGPTMVINCSLVGAVREALKSEAIEGVYGALNGLRGVLDENLIDLGKESEETLSGIAETPSAALGTIRLKVASEHYERILDVFEAHNVRYFFYTGGNDSMQTCLDIQNLAKESGYELRVIGIPKTIDNDLAETDHCPGYGSAARVVALATKSIAMDNESMRRVHIVEAMGRDAGWLTAASVLGRQGRGDPPHLVYPPEKAFEQDKFLRGVEEVYSRLGHAEVVVSEGIRNVEGDLLAASHTLDSFGHPHLGGVAERLASLVQAELKVAARFDVLGTLQRSFMPCVSRTDRKEAFEVGKRAVREALKGAAGKMVTLVRKSSDPYVCETGLADLEKVAFRTRPLEERYILDAGADIAPSFVNYVEPLAEGAKFTSSVPRFYRLKGHPVKKRLRPYQES